MTMRKDVLDQAAACVCKDRNRSYGPPEDSFVAIGGNWRWYIKTRFGVDVPLDENPDAVAMLLDGMKTARQAVNPKHLDTYIDKAGYSACAAECAIDK